MLGVIGQTCEPLKSDRRNAPALEDSRVERDGAGVALELNWFRGSWFERLVETLGRRLCFQVGWLRGSDRWGQRAIAPPNPYPNTPSQNFFINNRNVFPFPFRLVTFGGDRWAGGQGYL